MSNLDKYLWLVEKDKYKRCFYIKFDEPPYYLGNKDYDILNFRPSYQKSRTWIGDRDGSNFVLNLIDDDEYLQKEYPECYLLKEKYSIQFGLLELNGNKISDELYLIGTNDQVSEINSEINSKISRKMKCNIL